MRTYSLDLRERLLDTIDRGMPSAEMVRTFGACFTTIKRYLKRRKETGSVAPSESWAWLLIGSEQHKASRAQPEGYSDASLERISYSLLFSAASFLQRSNSIVLELLQSGAKD
jgi:hypothetical protein